MLEIPCYLGYLAMAIGIVTIFGWFTGIEVIQNPFEDLPSMSVLSATASILGGAMVCAFARKDTYLDTEKSEMLLWVGIILLAMIGIPLLAANTFDIYFGLEDYFSPRTVQGIQTNPVIASFGTVACMFLTLGVGIIALLRGKPFSKLIFLAGIMIIGIATLAIIGYLIGNPQLYYTSSRASGMAVRTVIGFLAIGLGFVIANHQKKHAAESPSIEKTTLRRGA